MGKRKRDRNVTEGESAVKIQKTVKSEDVAACQQDHDVIEDKNADKALKVMKGATQERLKQEWKENVARKKLKMQQPKVFLINEFTNSKDPKESSKPVQVSDLQDMVQFAVLGDAASINRIRFCKLLRPGYVSKVFVMVFNGMTNKLFQDNMDCFPHLTDNYNLTGEIRHDSTSEESIVLNELIFLPLSNRELKKREYISKYVQSVPNPVEPVSVPPLQARTNSTTGSKTKYLLSDELKYLWRYPAGNDPKYVHTIHSDSVTNHSPLVSVDCEMCVTRAGSELTRVSLVDEKHKVIYDSLVKPRNPIINYVTRFSGITKEMIDPVTTRIEDVQKDIKALLPKDAILVGQSLENDLRALKLYHPFIIDTSNLFTGTYKVALRKLAFRYLGVVMHDSNAGHCSTEDATVALKLLQLKIRLGDGLPNYRHMDSNHVAYKLPVPQESIFKAVHSVGKVSALLDSPTHMEQFNKEAVVALPCLSNRKTHKRAVKAISYADFICAKFNSFAKLKPERLRDEVVVKGKLSEMDERIKETQEKLPFNSLLVIIMAQDSTSDDQTTRPNASKEWVNGRFFIGLKVEH